MTQVEAACVSFFACSLAPRAIQTESVADTNEVADLWLNALGTVQP